MSAVIVLLWSCGERNQSSDVIRDSASIKTDTTAKVESPFFPVYDFLSNEIQYVDSTPVGIMRYSTVGKVKDSGYIQLEEFHRLVNEFLDADINDSLFKQKFQETSFADKSNGNATFFYRARDTSTAIRRVDIVTTRGEIYDEVKSIYIEKDPPGNDSIAVKKLYWKPKRNFQIITVRPSGKDELTKVVWDNRE